MESLRESMGASFILILAAAVVLNLLVFGLMDQILYLLQVPEEIEPLMREYLWWIFWGILATFLYNYFASLLRALGNGVGNGETKSVVPLASQPPAEARHGRLRHAACRGELGYAQKCQHKTVFIRQTIYVHDHGVYAALQGQSNSSHHEIFASISEDPLKRLDHLVEI